MFPPGPPNAGAPVAWPGRLTLAGATAWASMKASTCYLLSVNPEGVITGFSFAPASVKDQTLAEDFSAFRHTPHPRLPTFGGASPGLVCSGQRLCGPAEARLLWSLGNLSAQTQQQESPAQRIAPMAGWDAPDGGDRLRQAPPCLQAGLGAPTPTGVLSNQGGG